MHFRVALAALAFLSVSAGSAPTSELQPHTLIVFKDGVSWIEHRGDLTLSNGWGSIPSTPQAILGTVSLTAADGTTVDEVRTSTASKPADESILTLLIQNPGKNVTLRVGDRDVSGRLLSASPVVLLQSNGKTIAIGQEDVSAVTFDGEIVRGETASPSALRFRVAGNAATVPVRFSYLRKDFGWFPDYSLVLDDQGRATLTLRATLVNDGEELRDTDVFFAVGVPNFKFGHVESPLSARQSLAELFNTLGGGGGGGYQLFMANANVMENLRSPVKYVEDGSSGETTIGDRAEDFFFYSRKEVTLAKGERAAFPLLQASVKYANVYTVDLVGAESEETSDKVWHSIRLRNSTQTPWTTAPALVFAKGRPIGQAMLQYAPVNGDTTIRLTVANSITVNRSEAEVSRQREAIQRFNSKWDAVTIEGTVTVRNFKDEDVTVAITRNIAGEATRTGDLRVTRGAAQPRAMNPSERLEWEVAVDAGKTKTIKYQYKVFVQE
ncbi:MAG TPA: DUF4139 domain-containing protein [Thermoanaerobaculia bacterium]|nr:DUF4139 domain-containing protein [Thermoanaerobaculia bacterium]